jgi:copper chaperone NosL
MKQYLSISIMLCLLLSACTRDSGTKPSPLELSRDHACAVCGMIIVDFPGAKAQVHYQDHKYSVFCSTLDLFLFYHQPDRPANIAALYVNDMAKPGQWIDAEKARYVQGGDVMGPMGEALVPFGSADDAEAYRKKHGGRVLSFSEVTGDMLVPAAPH